MSNIYNDLVFYNNLFSDTNLSVKEQSATINWSERKCYVFKFFITKLSLLEIEKLKISLVEPEYELIGAMCIHGSEIRNKLFDQLERIQQSESPFEEIGIITNENLSPNPLDTANKGYWIAVKNYLEEREYDEYPFNIKSRNFLMSIARVGYNNLSKAQLNYINGLIENDRKRADSDRFFVNEYLVEKGFVNECKAIREIWLNL